MSEHTTRKLIEDLAPLDGTAPRQFAEGGPVGTCDECGECRGCQARRMAGGVNDDRNTETKGTTMTEIDTRVLIEKLAPLDGTAQALAKHLVAQTFAAQARMFGHPGMKINRSDADFADWLCRLDDATTAFAASFLVQKLAEVAPDVANAAAVEIQERLEDGQDAFELAEWWMEQHGFDTDDAERIVQAVQAERSEVTA